jgi:hypothetical protein
MHRKMQEAIARSPREQGLSAHLQEDIARGLLALARFQSLLRRKAQLFAEAWQKELRVPVLRSL